MIITEVHRNKEVVADLILDRQQIVAIFQNHSEWGPRALGNRSILFDPANIEATLSLGFIILSFFFVNLKFLNQFLIKTPL